MIKFLKQRLARQNFFPGFLGLFVNPFFFARRGLAQNIKKMAPHITGKILDVGCGRKPYKELFKFSEYIGIDIENPGHNHENEDIDVFYDGKIIPFESSSFDSIVTNQVFEHVFDPDNFIKELHRVLKPNGKVLLTVPFVWDEHEQPNDYARYSSFGLTHILEKNGFKVLLLTKSVDDFRIIFQLVNLFIYKKLVTRIGLVNRLMILTFIAPLNIIGLVIAKIFPSNSDLYLDNIVVAQKNN